MWQHTIKSTWSQIPEAEILQQSDKIVLILSGGLDSGVLLRFLASMQKQIHALSFNYGSKHNARELPFAGSLAQTWALEHHSIDIQFMGPLFRSHLLQGGGEIPDGHYEDAMMKQTVVPFRNGIMLAIAAGYAESHDIDLVVLGSHAGDHAIYPDCRPQFNQAMSQACALGTYNGVQVAAPFAPFDKREIADLGRDLDFDFRQTWTCYKGGKTHCGTCGACQERKYALRYDQGLDPTQYLA